MAKTIDVQLINAFYDSVIESFKTMGSMSVTRRSVSLKTSTQMLGNFYAVIGLSSGMVGNCAVSFSNTLAKQVCEQMFGMEIEEEELLTDAIGEIVNLIAGGGRRRLAGGKYTFEISPPTVLTNHDTEPLDIYNPASTECIIIECGIADFAESMVIELAFVPQNL